MRLQTMNTRASSTQYGCKELHENVDVEMSSLDCTAIKDDKRMKTEETEQMKTEERSQNVMNCSDSKNRIKKLQRF